MLVAASNPERLDDGGDRPGVAVTGPEGRVTLVTLVTLSDPSL